MNEQERFDALMILADFGAAALAVGAAIFWFLSAYGGLPPMITHLDFTPPNDPFYTAVRFSARMNTVAALLSGLSALCMGISLLMRHYRYHW
jgi:hypothetical protein